MVHGRPALFLLAPLEEREAGHPQEPPGLFVEEAPCPAQIQAQHPQNRTGLGPIGIGHEEQGVSLVQSGELLQTVLLRPGQELDQRPLQRAVLELEGRESGGPEFFGLILQVGDLPARKGRPSGKREAAHDAPLREQAPEGLE